MLIDREAEQNQVLITDPSPSQNLSDASEALTEPESSGKEVVDPRQPRRPHFWGQ